MDMAFVPSVLLIIEPQAPSQPSLGRALMLARYLHARLDILCPQSSVAGSPAQARKLLEEERQYTGALLQSIAAPDVDITIETAQGPLPGMLAAMTREKRSSIVIKARWHRATGGDPMDWQLLRHCPVPLLLTGGKPWHPRARMLAAVNVQRPGSESKNLAVLEAATALQGACGADLDLAYVESHPTNGNGHLAALNVQEGLEHLKTRFRLPSARVHLLKGQAAEALGAFAVQNAYDVLVVGAPRRHRAAPWPRFLSVAQSLSGIDCDLLSVQDPEGGLQKVLAEHRQRRGHAFPLWQWIGAD